MLHVAVAYQYYRTNLEGRNMGGGEAVTYNCFPDNKLLLG